MSPCIMKNHTIIRIFGTDAQKLLNNVLSVEFETKDNLPKFWSLLSPKGKILAQGLAIYYKGAFWLEIHKDLAKDFIKKLRLYKMRDDVEFENLENEYLVAHSEKKIIDEICFLDPRHKDLGYYIFAKKERGGNWQHHCEQYDKNRVELAIAKIIDDFAPDEIFPHDIGLDILGGVDFDKGCYIGQEVVSRMQHKANIKRRPIIVENIMPPDNGELFENDKRVGKFGKIIGGKAVGIVRLDRIIDKNNIFANQKRVIISTPSWANYSLG